MESSRSPELPLAPVYGFGGSRGEGSEIDDDRDEEALRPCERDRA